MGSLFGSFEYLHTPTLELGKKKNKKKKNDVEGSHTSNL